MPYKRKITKTKKRTTRTFNKKRKSAIRRRISYRKGKNWWSKYKKGYKFKKKDEKLLKFTTKCSIPELMEWMYPLAAKLVEAAGVGAKLNDQAGSQIFTNHTRTVCGAFMQMFMAYDDRSVYNIRGDPISHAAKLNTYFYGFNPIITRHQAGSLFDTYLNMYRYMKYVGIKVKWKPNSNYANAFAYAQNGDGSIHQDTISNDYLPPIPDGMAQVGQVQFLTQPEVYFNVIYNKDFYEEYPWQLRCLNIPYSDTAVIPADTAYKPPQDRFNPFCLLRRFKLYDQYDQQTCKVKKYPLSKPFKFYVRPYESIYHYELSSGVNQSVVQGLTSSNYFDEIYANLNYNEDRDYHRGVPKPATWRDTEPNSPYYLQNAPNYNTSAEGLMKTTAFYNALVDDRNYYNPTLFGFNFTHNGTVPDSVLPLVVTSTQPQTSVAGPGNLLNSTATAYAPGLSALGDFYFTVYYRFKGRRPSQIIPSSAQLQGPLKDVKNNPIWY